MNHQYRKKPVVIEAFQMTRERREDNTDWPEWLNRAWNTPRNQVGALMPSLTCVEEGENRLAVNTLEGQLTVNWDYWIIRGVRGELYPCKPDIFEATYEKVGEDD